MTEDEVAQIIVQAAYDLHRELGPGLLESVYEVLLAKALKEQVLEVECQKPIPIIFRGDVFDEGFRADLIVSNLVLVELKSADAIAKVHHKQTLTYLRLTGLKIALIINFGGPLLKGNIERLANGFKEAPR